MSEILAQLVENVAAVNDRIAAAAARSGRASEDVRLVAVTKYVASDVVRALFEAGCHTLGESRPQQLWQKAAALAELPIRWHMIGHLQRNKVARTVALVEMIESVDSRRLLEAVDRAGAEFDRQVPVLLEVNISGDEAKHGLAPGGVEPLLVEAASMEHVVVRGLMCMAGLGHRQDAARRDFAALRDLRDRLARNCPDNIELNELSMGMSGDYEVAIEEGATLVRVGSALFEGMSL